MMKLFFFYAAKTKQGILRINHFLSDRKSNSLLGWSLVISLTVPLMLDSEFGGGGSEASL